MNILDVTKDIRWLPQPNEVRVVLDDAVPPLDLVTGAHVLAFDGDRILLVDIMMRGWSLPGGHVDDDDEGPEDAARREALEEGGVLLGEARLLAHQEIRILGAPPPRYRYPCPVSYQVYYLAAIERLLPFFPSYESRARELFAPEDARAVGWVRRHHALYEAALQAATA